MVNAQYTFIKKVKGEEIMITAQQLTLFSNVLRTQQFISDRCNVYSFDKSINSSLIFFNKI